MSVLQRLEGGEAIGKEEEGEKDERGRNR